ncbi:hypothetical protein GV791_19475 [Nocardia cyriacigeorgica]|uniref:Acyl-CoA carboxylase subunit epsilon n=1 Tax=Nocardia cyriacigeorgica TaxID=135487 RepID=A0A6P1CSS8_9NOCA|nr:hypothetical protein [Nocardia cyriacigeorgica]MBF6424135.1 hypothetical protein [Nocardia cyriacigeorgica]NEW34723.1 hypothetical protein [Nocardia cyriacigeorgica]
MTAIRVLHGRPTDADLAVLVLVLATAGGSRPPAVSATAPGPNSAWRTSRTTRYRRAPAAWGPAPRQHRQPQPA